MTTWFSVQMRLKQSPANQLGWVPSGLLPTQDRESAEIAMHGLQRFQSAEAEYRIVESETEPTRIDPNDAIESPEDYEGRGN